VIDLSIKNEMHSRIRAEGFHSWIARVKGAGTSHPFWG
jgi:hypothetical protein